LRSRIAPLALLILLLCVFLGSCGPAANDYGGTGGISGGGPAAGEVAKHPEPVVATGEGELESASTAALEKILFDSINRECVATGLARLDSDEDLAGVARGYSREMASTGLIAHVSPISGGPGDRARKAEVAFVRLTENLAKAPNAEIAHDGLMSSSGHRANILDPDVTVCGVGVVLLEEGQTTSILVTQVFASRPMKIRPREAAAAALKIFDEQREALGLERLGRLRWLDRKAEEALVTCFGDGPLPTMGLKPSDPVTRATTIGFLVGEIEALAEMIDGDTPGISRPEFTKVGIAVEQGDHPDYGKDVVCVRAVVGG
jgi:hypothetical protein